MTSLINFLDTLEVTIIISFVLKNVNHAAITHGYVYAEMILLIGAVCCSPLNRLTILYKLPLMAHF